jgi:hypothetical protein
MTRARELHRALDRQFAETHARDDGADAQPELVRPIRFRRRDLMMSDASLIRAAKLWKKKSERNGRDYFVGRLGGCRVLILGNNDAAAEGEERNSHWLLLGQAEDKPRDGKGARR